MSPRSKEKRERGVLVFADNSPFLPGLEEKTKRCAGTTAEAPTRAGKV